MGSCKSLEVSSGRAGAESTDDADSVLHFSLVCVCVGLILEESFLVVDSAPSGSRPPQ